MRARADGASDFSDGHFFRGVTKTRDVAAIFVVPVGDFEAEGDGFGMDAVSAADFGSVFELPGAALEDFGEFVEARGDMVGGFVNQQRLRGVDNVVRGEAVVQPARGFGIADGFADGDGESDDVVADARFDFENFGDINARAFAETSCRFAGDNSRFGENISRGQLDIEPFLEAVFVAPNATHFRARIAIDQDSLPARAAKTCEGHATNGSKGNGEIPCSMIPEVARARAVFAEGGEPRAQRKEKGRDFASRRPIRLDP
jgi:hypothetical protein